MADVLISAMQLKELEARPGQMTRCTCLRPCEAIVLCSQETAIAELCRAGACISSARFATTVSDALKHAWHRHSEASNSNEAPAGVPQPTQSQPRRRWRLQLLPSGACQSSCSVSPHPLHPRAHGLHCLRVRRIGYQVLSAVAANCSRSCLEVAGCRYIRTPRRRIASWHASVSFTRLGRRGLRQYPP